MRLRILVLLILGFVPPAFASKPVTVAQLAQIVAASKANPDEDLAWQIASLQLTERLSSARLAHLQNSLPGDKSREALRIPGDQSLFRDPPATEIPSLPAPDIGAQKQIMSAVVAYVHTTIPQLRNFFATRVAARFEDTPQLQLPDRPFIPYAPMHFVGRSQATVLYRDGREVVEASAGRKKAEPFTEGLRTWGVFGPILGTVLVDAAKSKLTWSHWEQGPNGVEAVFRFEVPQDRSNYEVDYCCVASESATAVANVHPFRRLVGYHGSMTVDPWNGTILRLIVQAELKPTEPVTKSEILVEYGAVEIGGRSYICPVRSISSTVAETVQLHPVYKYPLANQIQPMKAALNEDSFERYHVFRADARVLTP